MLIERTLTAWDPSGQRKARISHRIFSTVEGVRSGSNVVVKATIDRFEGDTTDQSATYEPGTNIRLVYGADGRPRGAASWRPDGNAVLDAVTARLLQNTFSQGVGVIFILYDLSTSIQVYANWRTLTPIHEGEKRAHFSEVAKLSLPPNLADVRPDRPTRVRRESPPAPSRTSGSGFVITGAGHILTNAHVIKGCSEIQASDGALIETTGMTVRPKRRSQVTSGTRPLEVMSVDARNDLALLKSAVPVGTAAAFRGGRGVRTGESIIVAGFSMPGILSSDLNVTTGNISALAGPGNDRSLIQITAPVQLGNSGGPVLNVSGNVVGVVFARIDAIKLAERTGRSPQNVNFAISAGTVRAFLDANAVPYWTKRSVAELKSVDVAAMAKDFTVFIKCQKNTR